MKTPYYELHITIMEPPEREELVRNTIASTLWKFSKIEGDPILGAGVKMYATYHVRGKLAVARAAVASMLNLLRLVDLNVVRAKIECVVYDHIVENRDGQPADKA